MAKKRNQKTTACGAIAGIAGIVAASGYDPVVTKIAATIAAAATWLGFYFSRDKDVTSEDMGLIQTPRGTPPSLLLLFILAPLLCLTGCTSQRDESIADSAATIHNAAESLPPSGQRTAIMANARGIAHAVGHDLPPVEGTTP